MDQPDVPKEGDMHEEIHTSDSGVRFSRTQGTGTVTSLDYQEDGSLEATILIREDEGNITHVSIIRVIVESAEHATSLQYAMFNKKNVHFVAEWWPLTNGSEAGDIYLTRLRADVAPAMSLAR